MFIDRVTMTLTAGRGGHGIIAWRREKYIPKGGPYGGNGGPGGSIILRADSNQLSLEKYHGRYGFKAKKGSDGGPNKQQGRKGEDLVLKVPVGTIARDARSGQILCDLTLDGEEYIICKGGKGGLGNYFFKSPTNQAPNRCTQGKDGQSLEVELELKIIADAGLIGMPNAGKSTLLSELTSAKVKIAPYPFTTLSPNLGFVEFEDYSQILLADIPGIVAEAHKDKGLGIAFLRHIERTEILIFVLDASGSDGRNPLEDFEVLQHELRSYSPDLLQKPFMVILNKMDEPAAKEYAESFQKTYCGAFPILEASALQQQGLKGIKKNLYNFRIADPSIK